MNLNVGCGTHYAPGWVNVDVRVNENTRPDVVVDPAAPFAPFRPGTVQRLYLGHVLEHVPWRRVVPFLTEARSVMAAGGEVLAVGPDVYRTIRRWREGHEPWSLVESVLEHADQASDDWPEAVHWWCCHEERLVAALTAAGFSEVAPTTEFDGWPVVAWAPWQCAARGVA